MQLETFIPWTLVKRRVRREIITPLDAPVEFREEAAVEHRETEKPLRVSTRNSFFGCFFLFHREVFFSHMKLRRYAFFSERINSTKRNLGRGHTANAV